MELLEFLPEFQRIKAKFEPEVDGDAIEAFGTLVDEAKISTAISLKRIADALEVIELKMR
jgi:hypothetical protein